MRSPSFQMYCGQPLMSCCDMRIHMSVFPLICVSTEVQLASDVQVVGHEPFLHYHLLQGGFVFLFASQANYGIYMNSYKRWIRSHQIRFGSWIFVFMWAQPQYCGSTSCLLPHKRTPVGWISKVWKWHRNNPAVSIKYVLFLICPLGVALFLQNAWIIEDCWKWLTVTILLKWPLFCFKNSSCS